MCYLITVTISLRKSERPVSKTEDFWKQFALLVKNRSMNDGFEGFLKQSEASLDLQQCIRI